jgi:hypothetical protein
MGATPLLPLLLTLTILSKNALDLASREGSGDSDEKVII